MFEFTRRLGAHSILTESPTFQVSQLTRRPPRRGQAIDVSHLIDTSYAYHSPRELRWHLAERFGLTPGAVDLREAA